MSYKSSKINLTKQKVMKWLPKTTEKHLTIASSS